MIPPRFLWLGQTETDFRSVFNLATDGVGGRHVLNPVSKGFNRIALIFKYDLVFLFGFINYVAAASVAYHHDGY